MQGPLRILIVQHESDAGPGLVAERLAQAGCALTIAAPAGVVPDAVSIPRSPQGFDGVIVLGGTPGPTDDDRAPWLSDVRALIGACIDLDHPLLGICLGAQLVAHVAGGLVTALPDSPEIGVVPLWPTEAAFGDPLLTGLEPPLQAVQWHELEVSELPPGARLLCRGDRCANQAFRVGRSAWGVQFHLEVLSEGVREWARTGGADLDRAGVSGQALLEDARAAEAGLRALWGPVIDNFAAVCIDRRANA